MLVPPETRSTIGTSTRGSTEERSTPRVSISVSAYGASGAIVAAGDSRPEVGPRK